MSYTCFKCGRNVTKDGHNVFCSTKKLARLWAKLTGQGDNWKYKP